MKILLISPKEGVVGGIAVWTKNVLSNLEKRCDIDVFLNDFSRQAAGQMIHNPLKKWLLAIKDYSKLVLRAKADIKNKDITAVHICSSASFLLIKDLILLRTCKSRKLQAIIHFHFGRIPDLSQTKNWEWTLIKKVCACADKVIVMDKKSYHTLLDEGFNNIFLLPNPISEDTKCAIENINVARKINSLLFAGHCIPTKGVYELIEACKNISSIHLTMIGAISSQMKQELISLAGVNANEWLEIKGQVSYEDTLSYMKRSSIFILPTYTEGFPNVILESMASGCCVIASAVGAIPEMLEEENSQYFGVLIEPRNAIALQNAIEKTISDSELIVECGNNAKQRVYERYNIQSICNQLVDIWRD